MNELITEKYGCTDLTEKEMETTRGGATVAVWTVIGLTTVALAYTLWHGYDAYKSGVGIIRKKQQQINSYIDYSYQYGGNYSY